MAKKNRPKYKVDIIWSDEDGAYIARVPELPGCMTDGETIAQAAANAEEAIESYVETLAATGQAIPEPIASKTFSGKLNLRISPALHRDATIEALARHQSLNAFIATTLEGAVHSLDTGAFVQEILSHDSGGRITTVKGQGFVETVGMSTDRACSRATKRPQPQPLHIRKKQG